MILQILLPIFFLIIVPIALGLPWTQCVPGSARRSLFACFPFGFFTELALFHFLAVPFTFLNWSFTVLTWLFTGLTVIFSTVSAVWFIRKKKIVFRIPKFSVWEYIYLAAFLGLLGWQLYNGLIGDISGWAFDDTEYVTIGADAIRYDRMLAIDPNTGLAASLDSLRALQSSLFFPAVLSKISGMPITIMYRTVLEVFYILLAYAVYAYMATVIFKKKEDGLIFLIFLSLLHIFGFYSQYSITFRLLGPNYQGKAILAASLIPLLFVFLIQRTEEQYDWKSGLLLLLLSTAATSLTMFGASTSILSLTLVVILSLFRKKRNWKHLWYLAWGCAMPLLYGSVYFIYKYYVW